MSLPPLKEVIMERDKISSEEADAQIADAKERLNEYLDEGDMISAMDICAECFGLEPDWLEELIDG